MSYGATQLNDHVPVRMTPPMLAVRPYWRQWASAAARVPESVRKAAVTMPPAEFPVTPSLRAHAANASAVATMTICFMPAPYQNGRD